MKRPSYASVFWFIAFAAVSYLLIARTGEKAADEVIFGKKVFYDSGGQEGFVGITGTLTGSDLGYPNNTTVIACYSGRRECLVYAVQQIGPNQIGRLDFPVAYPITKWDETEIIASDDLGVAACRRITISVVRKSETAVWVEQPINVAKAACKDVNTAITKWTIEDSPGWKRIFQRR